MDLSARYRTESVAAASRHTPRTVARARPHLLVGRAGHRVTLRLREAGRLRETRMRRLREATQRLREAVQSRGPRSCRLRETTIVAPPQRASDGLRETTGRSFRETARCLREARHLREASGRRLREVTRPRGPGLSRAREESRAFPVVPYRSRRRCPAGHLRVVHCLTPPPRFHRCHASRPSPTPMQKASPMG